MSDLIGQTIGKYKISDYISKGGTATVYRARDQVLDREVAFKILHTHLEDANHIIERFKLEARMIAQLTHTNIVSVFDFFEYEGRAVVIMELIEGSTLSDLVRLPYAVPEDYVLMIAMEILKGLREAHRRGIIHRDVKPANILISPTRGVKLSDFGLAKLKESDAGLTQEGIFVGTPSFSSPEQIQGLPLDQRSDIFSLGLTLFVLAKKAHAFKERGDSQDTVARKIVEGQKLELGSKGIKGLSPEVERILHKAIHIDPLHRYQNCDEMMRDIETIIRKRSIWPYEESLEDFLIDPERVCQDYAHSKTEALSEAPLSGSKISRFWVVVGAAGLGVSLVGLFAFIILARPTYQTWPLPFQLSGESQRLSSNSGAASQFFKLEPSAANRWLVFFENTQSIFDGQSFVHNFRHARRPQYQMEWGGEVYVSFLSRSISNLDSGFLLTTPWKDPYTSIEMLHSHDDTKNVDPLALLHRHLGRRYPKERGLVFSRDRLIASAQSELSRRNSEMNELCHPIKLQIAWGELTNEALFNVDPVNVCGRVIHLFQHLCVADVYREALQEEVGKIVCSFSKQNRFSLVENVFVWEADVKAPADVGEIFGFFKKRYSL